MKVGFYASASFQRFSTIYLLPFFQLRTTILAAEQLRFFLRSRRHWLPLNAKLHPLPQLRSMNKSLQLEILAQPTDTTCGPTCLHAVYGYHGDRLDLGQVIDEVGSLEDGGTLAVLLGCHALKRGYKATIYTYNLQVFDPTWFHHGVDLVSKLQTQYDRKPIPKLRLATEAYLDYLQLGGRIRMETFSANLLRKYLQAGIPILAGLSATFLYGEARERYEGNPQEGFQVIIDDLGGLPVGHFVVLCGYDPQRREVDVADPLERNPLSRDRKYTIDIDRVFAAIMLGVVTYDANLLVLKPPI